MVAERWLEGELFLDTEDRPIELLHTAGTSWERIIREEISETNCARLVRKLIHIRKLQRYFHNICVYLQSVPKSLREKLSVTFRNDGRGYGSSSSTAVGREQ
jgi:hypothetical protein